MRTVLILWKSPKVGLALVAALFLAACGDADPQPGDALDPSLPSIVVTTSVLGDVTEQLIGESANVVTLMPSGVDPHDFQPSAKQAAALTAADVIVVNGGGLEEGLLPLIEEAEHDGAVVCSALDGVTPLESEAADHTTTDDGGHRHGSEAETGTHTHSVGPGGVDPHFFSDPGAMADAASHLAHCIGDAQSTLSEHADEYVMQLRDLEVQMANELEKIAPDERVVVIDHNSFSSFAERYGFEVAGVISPGVSTHAEPSAADLAALAEVMSDRDIRVIVGESSVPNRLAHTLAAEVGGVEVVEFNTETLAPADSATSNSYVEMIRGNVNALVAAFDKVAAR
jgi:zinc/manganese transport system substrate-binding protein